MNLEKPVLHDSLVTLHYRLTGPDGELVNTFGSTPATLSMGDGALSPSMQSCLLQLKEGERKAFLLAPEAAFGEVNTALKQWITRAMLRELGEIGANYQLGEIVQFPTPDNQGTFSGVVVALADDHMDAATPVKPEDAAFLVDFNHPLAGLALTFEAEVIGVI